ncbi:Mov34/MPN/PAD-1 family protein [Cohnella sp. REN36]|uniref:Mov34/MPN/PAD-1 family protein n=1 Tax=Cohnella sp. REN36 TaxID=2887347 RepID=UPI001D14E737|nr:Mov34/MPN/PAD-1 family protein [Cohnella sp. REN36]
MANITQEVKKVSNVETGGALIGYLSDNYAVITHCSGPGPKSKLTRTSVTIDGNYTTRLCMDISSRSDGRLYYLGDWHTHLGNSLCPSATDISAMAVLLNEKVTPWSSLFSLILHKDLTTYRLYQFRLGKKFEELPVVTCKDPITIADLKINDLP